jgi:hypothetical protein
MFRTVEPIPADKPWTLLPPEWKKDEEPKPENSSPNQAIQRTTPRSDA